MKTKFKKGDFVVQGIKYIGPQEKIIYKIVKVWSIKRSINRVKRLDIYNKKIKSRFYTCYKHEGTGFSLVNGDFLRKANKEEIKEYLIDEL